MKELPVRFLFVHQGYDLYGSGRTFLQSLRAVRELYPESEIKVILPQKGLLYPKVDKIADKIEIDSNLLVLRSRKFSTHPLKTLQKLFLCLKKAKREIECHDITYVNTIVILDYILASWLCRRNSKVILHIHELPTRFVDRLLFSILINLSIAWLVFNSKATKETFFLARKNTFIVHNGVVSPKLYSDPKLYNKQTNILMIGRLIEKKGQGLLLDALNNLAQPGILRVRIVGDAYATISNYKQKLLEIIKEYKLDNSVLMVPFVEDPSEHYLWSDIVVVPSIKPEPFGLVAIEAMSYSKPVIGAAHGGLIEIIEGGASGILFKPGDAFALAQAIKTYADNRDVLVAHGKSARARYEKHFQESFYLDTLGRMFKEIQLGKSL
ncbi:MAG: glycosyltransferase family 4 protein [Chloroflexi bacterium]|nr:glycosyltransferase family 4 protein [Chloroflexota bacterium]MBT7484307.1 glycosyltransferase family 4 protein [Candidatus Peregrinibacteria bacterium]